MPYKTYTEQILEHLNHLQANGLDVIELIIDSPSWIRCHEIGKAKCRGELVYISNTYTLNNGCFCLRTSFRGINGRGSYQTYGLPPNKAENSIGLSHSNEAIPSKENELHELAARKAYGFWKYSNIDGISDYLMRKGVGSYGIRFRPSEQYGNVAVVPMFDEAGKLWSYQILNPDGTKRHPKNGRTKGLFHKLKEPVNGKPIGIAESYVTAATCMELSDIPMICAFSAGNLSDVTKLALSLFPASPIIIFGDDDRHLEKRGNQNVGRLKAQETKNVFKGGIILAFPDFCDLEPSKDASDWNDLVRLKGKDIALAQIAQFL